MRDPVQQVFEVLEPPAGGLAELRLRIAAERTPRRAWFGGLALAAAAAVALVVARPPTQEPGGELDPGLLRSEPTLAILLSEPQVEPVIVRPGQAGRLALRRVELPDAQVVYYRVAGANAPLGKLR